MVGFILTLTIATLPVDTAGNGVSSNATVVFDTTIINVQPDGKYVSYSHTKVRINTEAGRDQYARLIRSYYKSYSTVEILSAKTVKKDGRVIEVPKDMIKDVPMPAFGKFFIPNVRLKIVPFPDLEPGDWIEYSVKFNMHSPPMDSAFDDEELFQYTEPIENQYVEMTFPKSMPVKWKVYNGELEHDSTDLGDRYRLRWWANDVPQIVEEPGMVPFTDVALKLLVSSVPSWKTWSVWYANLTAEATRPDSAITAKSKELVAGAKSFEDSIKALHYYVEHEIRYVETSFSGKTGGYKPFPAPKTFRDRYGVCRDKAALLVSMLKAVGIDSSYMVLTNPSAKVEADVPVDQFNHAITAVLRDGKYIYIDPTAENARTLLPPYEQGKAMLVCTPWGEDLSYAPILPPDSQMTFIRNVAEVTENGDLHGHVRIEPDGMMDLILRGWLRMMVKDQMKIALESFVKDISTTANLDSFRISDPSDLTTPFTIDIFYSANEFATKADRFILFQMPLLAGAFDLSDWFVNVSLPERKYPLDVGAPVGTTAEDIIRIPLGYRVKALPDSLHAGIDGKFTIDAVSDFKDGQVVTRRVLRIYLPTISPQYYPELRKMFTQVGKLSRTRAVLEKEVTK